MLFILNSLVITTYGIYSFVPLSLQEAKDLIKSEQNFISAVGHESTSQILTSILGVNIPTNRIAISMHVGDRALVFKLKGRPHEGKILSIDEIESIGYEFGLLSRLS